MLGYVSGHHGIIKLCIDGMRTGDTHDCTIGVSCNYIVGSINGYLDGLVYRVDCQNVGVVAGNRVRWVCAKNCENGTMG